VLNRDAGGIHQARPRHFAADRPDHAARRLVQDVQFVQTRLRRDAPAGLAHAGRTWSDEECSSAVARQAWVRLDVLAKRRYPSSALRTTEAESPKACPTACAEAALTTATRLATRGAPRPSVDAPQCPEPLRRVCPVQPMSDVLHAVAAPDLLRHRPSWTHHGSTAACARPCAWGARRSASPERAVPRASRAAAGPSAAPARALQRTVKALPRQAWEPPRQRPAKQQAPAVRARPAQQAGAWAQQREPASARAPRRTQAQPAWPTPQPRELLGLARGLAEVWAARRHPSHEPEMAHEPRPQRAAEPARSVSPAQLRH